jgi:hypothetical protein
MFGLWTAFRVSFLGTHSRGSAVCGSAFLGKIGRSALTGAPGVRGGPQAYFAGSSSVMKLRELPLLFSGDPNDPNEDHDQRDHADLHGDCHHGPSLLSEAPPTLGSIIARTVCETCRGLATVLVYSCRFGNNRSTAIPGIAGGSVLSLLDRWPGGVDQFSDRGLKLIPGSLFLLNYTRSVDVDSARPI